MSVFPHFHNFIGIHYSPSGRERLLLGSLDLKRSSSPVVSGLRFGCIELRNLFDNKKHRGGKKKKDRCLNKHSCFPSNNGESYPRITCTRNKQERLQFTRSRLRILGYSYTASDARALVKVQTERMHSPYARVGGRNLCSLHLFANTDSLSLPFASQSFKPTHPLAF